MLALGVVSASLAVLGLASVVPARLGVNAGPWVTGFAVAELSALSTGVAVAAEHFPSTPGDLGIGGAGTAGLLLFRAAQAGRKYSRTFDTPKTLAPGFHRRAQSAAAASSAKGRHER